MENATKALLIAGAVLIAILLIGVGVIVMNSINSPIDQATKQAESQAVEMFNSKFTGYAGVQTASAVKQLLTAINSNTDTSHKINITGIGTDVGKIQSELITGTNYTVTFTYGNDGYIININIDNKIILSGAEAIQYLTKIQNQTVTYIGNPNLDKKLVIRWLNDNDKYIIETDASGNISVHH